MPGDLLSGALIEVARDLREKRVTARELIEAAIARHERFGERLQAYSLWAPEQARAVAAAADAAFSAGVTAGPLQGLPVSIKDLFAASGYPCFARSSRRLPSDPWEQDGALVATLRRQLGVITGKTHMVEFAFGGTGHNSHWGAPYNPWDVAAPRAPGGSSSGAGVSLLEGSALLAFGSDTASQSNKKSHPADISLDFPRTGSIAVHIDGPCWVAPRLAPSGWACGGASIATSAMLIQRSTIMAKQQSRKPAKDADKIGASEANQPTRKGEHQPRQRKPRTRSGRAAAETNSAAAAELPKASVKNSARSITSNEPPEKAALQPSPRSKGADTAPVSASSPDLPRASTKRAMLIGMLERAQGASVAEIGHRLGWLPHTVRAAITGLRHAGRDVTRRKNESGQTVYRLAPVETQGR